MPEPERLEDIARSAGLFDALADERRIVANDAADIELIALLDMADIANRQTEGFSTGEQGKVAIARALVHQPQNVMLDEPTAGLDVMSTRAMRGVIRKLREDGRCLLFSSHIMQEVAMLCDNIVVIAGGRVVAQGSPDELRARTGQDNLEDAFVSIIGTKEGLV